MDSEARQATPGETVSVISAVRERRAQPPEEPAGLHITAGSDAEAVAQWLAEYRASPHTQRAYRREAERLLLWLADQKMTLTALRRDHLDAFEAFLGDPRPRERWVGPTRPRHDPRWRPFRGPLSPASRRQSLVILQGLCAWLVEAGWLGHNPFRLMRDKRRRLDNRQGRVERYLEKPLWDWLWRWLTRAPAAEATSRERFEARRRCLAFGFAYLLAPRIGEMAAARMNDFHRREGRWWWAVVGKGGKAASIPVPPDMLRLLGEWRGHLGLAPEPGPDETTPLLRGLDGRRGLGENRLYRLIRATFDAAATDLEATPGAKAVREVSLLRRATPHWLRHTALTHQAQAGVELRYLAETARHSRLDTTSRYLHAEEAEWHRQQSWHGLDTDARQGADDGRGQPV
ncbi:tyrosine-type recombinase/integrase [Halomonas cerina]|uniref:Integrase n=1 Tax=Halomonas cerina TaxID=447424 RepID=A0A839V014_9GAMM|nr:site-specific integrase [Halomonas cerina]MBB3189113.1 integrase [Halomonas cerina]